MVAICNGEIYGFDAQRDALSARGHRFQTGSDVEVIVHLYEERGIECLSSLRGMFALALWDAPARRLLLARDRLGIKPLYYAIDQAGLWFGSEQKALLAAERMGGDEGGATFDRRLDLEAVRDLFTWGFVRESAHSVRRDSPAPARALPSLGAWGGHSPAVVESRVPGCPGARQPHGAGGLGGSAPRDPRRERAAPREERRPDRHLAQPRGGTERGGESHARSGPHRSPPSPWASSIRGRRDRTSGHARPLPSIRACRPPRRVRARRPGAIPEGVWHAETPSVSGLKSRGCVLAKLTASQVKVVLTGEGSDELFGGLPVVPT